MFIGYGLRPPISMAMVGSGATETTHNRAYEISTINKFKENTKERERLQKKKKTMGVSTESTRSREDLAISRLIYSLERSELITVCRANVWD